MLESMILAATASNYVYGVGYLLQLAGVLLTAIGLWSVRKRFRSELDALWASTPDPVISWIAARREGARRLLNSALVKLHLKRPETLTRTASDSLALTSTATASATAGPIPPFDPRSEIGPQFDALANLVRTTRQTVMDLEKRLQELIGDERLERTEGLKQLDDKMRAVSFGGFGLTVGGVALLVVGIVLEIIADFV